MDEINVQKPSEDVNIGTATFIVCWTLTAIVGVALTFRYAAKAWIRWAVRQISAPEGGWGLNDLLFLIGYVFDIMHMITVELSYHWGLGRHFYHLKSFEQVQSLKYGTISQPLAVMAAMISRTGIAWALLTCFAKNNKRMRVTIFACVLVQVVVNTVAVLQMLLQCGPRPYRSANRLEYFHYMWDTIPADGSVTCQSPSVQTTMGFVQGGFNAVVDLSLAAIAAIEVWQVFIQTVDRKPGVSAWTRFRKISRSMRSRWIWQTVTLSGPLLLSGAISIVKTYRLKSLRDTLDFTYDTVDYVLWAKIENYSILLASCAPVAWLFLRTFIDNHREGRYAGYWPSNTRNNHNGLEMQRHGRGKSNSTTATGNSWDDRSLDYAWEPSHEGWESRVSKASLPAHLLDGCVTVKTDIIVEVDKRLSRVPFMAESPPDDESLKDLEAHFERHI